MSAINQCFISYNEIQALAAIIVKATLSTLEGDVDRLVDAYGTGMTREDISRLRQTVLTKVTDASDAVTVS